MNRQLKEKIQEALSSVLPITIIVFVLSISFVPIPIGMTVMFLAGAAMLIVGMGFFSLGTDTALMPIGSGAGAALYKIPKIWLILLVGFGMGFMITVAEPDLQVLAEQVQSIPNVVLIVTVALGVAAFLVLAMFRIFFKWSFARVVIIFYLLAFVLAKFAPADFVPLAFDSGGVTTGPITVPFIMAIGVGLASARSGKEQQDDSFGLVSLCTLGPILAVLILGITYDTGEGSYATIGGIDVVTTRDVALYFLSQMPRYIKEVSLAVAPIFLFFLLFQAITKRFTMRRIVSILFGFVYTWIGLILFLAGVNIGFIQVGHLLGSTIAGSEYSLALIPVGALIGYYIVKSEPTVHVLNKQVEEVSHGAISQRAMKHSLSIGVATSLGFSMVRILTGISIFWLLIPGYAAAMILTFFVPKMFTGIAFDSGGVASGPMSAAFTLPFAIGASEGIGGNVLTDAFGVVAVVSMTPLITIQLMGLIYTRRAASLKSTVADGVTADEIVDFDDKIIDTDSEEGEGK